MEEEASNTRSRDISSQRYSCPALQSRTAATKGNPVRGWWASNFVGKILLWNCLEAVSGQGGMPNPEKKLRNGEGGREEDEKESEKIVWGQRGGGRKEGRETRRGGGGKGGPIRMEATKTKKVERTNLIKDKEWDLFCDTTTRGLGALSQPVPGSPFPSSSTGIRKMKKKMDTRCSLKFEPYSIWNKIP